MKTYIANRIQEAEDLISEQIKCCRGMYAHTISYDSVRTAVLYPLQIKSMPVKYEEHIAAILNFVWKKDILRNIMYPVVWKGRLYSKWREFPKELQNAVTNDNYDRNGSARFPVFKWHFEEGMKTYKQEE
jgi:hypothetical protein